MKFWRFVQHNEYELSVESEEIFDSLCRHPKKFDVVWRFVILNRFSRWSNDVKSDVGVSVGLVLVLFSCHFNSINRATVKNGWLQARSKGVKRVGRPERKLDRGETPWLINHQIQWKTLIRKCFKNIEDPESWPSSVFRLQWHTCSSIKCVQKLGWVVYISKFYLCIIWAWLWDHFIT